MITDDDIHFFSYADYDMWNKIAFITLGEFIYLANGFDPMGRILHNLTLSQEEEMNYHHFFVDFSPQEFYNFKNLWKKINRFGRELPKESNEQIKVSYLKQDLPHYEATFLINWAEAKGVSVHSSYTPIESIENKKRRVTNNFINRQFLSRDEIVEILKLYNPEKEVQFFEAIIFEGVQTNSIQPISEVWNYTIPPEERNFKFSIQSVHEFIKKMSLNFLKLDPTDENQKEKNVRDYFKDGEILLDGLIDVRQIHSTKLLLALENYIINMRQDTNQIPSTDAVKRELIEKYGQYGVGETMARVIDECSRHDSRANKPPKKARKKTIFFQ